VGGIQDQKLLLKNDCVYCVAMVLLKMKNISVCYFYNNERKMLQRNISSLLGQEGVTYDFITLLKQTDPDILHFVGKFIYVCMQKRDTSQPSNGTHVIFLLFP
jgi:hypothetical protein